MTIYFNLNSELKSLIEIYDSPKEALDILKLNLTENRVAHMSIYHQFLECSKGDGESISFFFVRLLGVVVEFSKIGKPVDNLYVIFQPKITRVFSNGSPVLTLGEGQFKFRDVVTELLA